MAGFFVLYFYQIELQKFRKELAALTVYFAMAVVASKAWAFPAQSARLCLLRFAQSQSSCADCPLYRNRQSYTVSYAGW